MLVATFHVELSAIALDQAFKSVPEMVVEAEQIAAHGRVWTMPCLWVAADDFDAVDDALATAPSVDRIIEGYDYDDEKFYHLDWNDAVHKRIDAYVDKRGSILSAEATANGWVVKFRFVDRDQLDAFRERLSEQDYSFELLELFEPDSPRSSIGSLTSRQRDALVAAANYGYYKVPRDISTRELADELDMAHQSVSELLRRGTERLITATLMTAEGADRDE